MTKHDIKLLDSTLRVHVNSHFLYSWTTFLLYSSSIKELRCMYFTHSRWYVYTSAIVYPHTYNWIIIFMIIIWTTSIHIYIWYNIKSYHNSFTFYVLTRLDYGEDHNARSMDCCQAIEVDAEDVSEEFLGKYTYSGTYRGYPVYKYNFTMKTFYIFYQDHAWLISSTHSANESSETLLKLKGHSTCPEHSKGRWSKVENAKWKLGPQIKISCQLRNQEIGIS